MKNKKIIIPVAVVLFIAILFLIAKNILASKVKYSYYDKYETLITIDTKKDQKITTELITVKDDGEAASVSKTGINRETYITNNTLYTIEGTNIYAKKIDFSYRELYRELSKQKKLDKEKADKNYTTYTSEIEIDSLNRLLECLFSSKKTTEASVIKIMIKDSYIEEINMPVKIEGYDEVTINIRFKKLADDFKIDTRKLYGSTSLGSTKRYKILETKENPYEVLK